ncbi:MAG: 5-(carboxyamino)imidazole ribonucleotide mutase [Elusimicrobia bacterium]|nr:5-(carboxyamino)imidazole ribonucleotide mutase [Elusimicrobiota bacterium]
MVYIILGSRSDLEYGKAALGVLETFGVKGSLRVASAHRAPAWLHEVIKKGEKAGVNVFICAAGGAAHLPGVAASLTTRPVLGVGIPAKYLGGLDSLMSLIQMPAGVPVAFCGLGDTGMKNAAYCALQILALNDKKLSAKLDEYKKKLERENREANDGAKVG